MKYIQRHIDQLIKDTLKRNKSVLLLGPRQTGKTTIVNRLQNDLMISLVQPNLRLRYEKNPGLLTQEIDALADQKGKSKPLIILDEVQKVPQLLDAVQDLIDRKVANFILTGSSARKLRKGSNVNLLPGRVIVLKLDPLSFTEHPDTDLINLLMYGTLPGIISENKKDQTTDLESYVTTYLEEEIRAEAIVRNLGSFARFLEYAAAESGNIINLRKLSQEIGVVHTTIASYFQILEDCLIIERIDPITTSPTRKRLTKTCKYLFFDLGIRRITAKEGTKPPKKILGHLFEQFVGLELLRKSRLSKQHSTLKFWRDPDGPEVDWVVETEKNYIPIEVKWTDSPTIKDTKGLQIFLKEYTQAKTGFIICQTPRKMKLTENIFAYPWQNISELF